MSPRVRANVIRIALAVVMVVAVVWWLKARNTIVVSTQLPGASAETIASAVTTPLERQFGQVPSLTQMTSVSSFGSSQITLQFELDRDIDAAEQDVQAAINAATNLLPRTLPAPPTYSKSNPADQPILTLAASSETLPLAAVSDFADSVLAQKISQVSGVGLVTIGGGQKPAVRVQVDPVALAGAGLTLEEVRLAIAAANVNQPKGNLVGPRQDWAILLAGAAAFLKLPVAPLPRVDIPTINISGSLPGASPTTMATAVAMPLERRFGRIAGVTEITSESSLGNTSITVQFNLDKDVETAAREVQAAIQAAGGDLPANMPSRPRYRKVNPGDAPILIIALTSKTLPIEQVYEAANTVLAQKISQVSGVGQVGVGGGVQPAVRVRVDPQLIAGMGLSMTDVRTAMQSATANQPKGGVGAEQWLAISSDDSQIDNVLYDAFGQRQVATYYTQINQYRVILEATTSVGSGPEAIDNLYVTSSSGHQISLSELVRVKPTNVALSISHQGQFPSNTISFNTPPGVALSQAVAAIEQATLTMGMPASINASFSGTAAAFRDSLATLPMLFLLAIVAIYIVLGVLYESYVHPLTILSTLPSAGLGALLALLVTDSQLDLIAFVGIVLLIGIVKKNAILMIDFALELEREGKSPRDAIYEACVLRFRPILMTTLAALLGAIPLALGSGTGSELRKPLGIAIVGGLVVSQLLTLFTTPVTYLALHRFTRRSQVPL